MLYFTLKSHIGTSSEAQLFCLSSVALRRLADTYLQSYKKFLDLQAEREKSLDWGKKKALK
jgi:hypothetical protein